MKPKLNALTLSILGSLAVGQAANSAEPCGTEVGGLIFDRAWTVENSPYCVTNSITLLASLTIEAGVEVRFMGDYECEVKGELHAEGSADQPIRFYPADPDTGWQGMVFRDAAPGSYLVHTTIEGSKNGGLRITATTPPALTNCFIVNNSSPGNGGGISADIGGVEFVMVDCLVATNTAAGSGGGIHLIARDAAITLKRCTVILNEAVRSGGGVNAELRSTRITLEECEVSRNEVTLFSNSEHCFGAGLALQRSEGGDATPFTVELSRCRVTENTVEGNHGSGRLWAYGGGLAVLGGNAVLNNCVVSRNEARQTGPHQGSWNRSNAAGGGLYIANEEDIEVVAENCIFAGNLVEANSTAEGAGVYLWVGSFEAINCTVVENSTAHAIQLKNTSTASVLNSIVFNNNNRDQQMSDSVVASYSCVQNGWLGEGNIGLSPALCPDTLALLLGSPCIDAGHPGLMYRDACIDDNTLCTQLARGRTRNDMGAYGGPDVAAWVGSCPKPDILTQPKNTMAFKGQPATLSVVAAAPEAVEYLWFKDGMPIEEATDPMLSFPQGVQLDDDVGVYNVEIFDGHANSISWPVRLMLAQYEMVALSRPYKVSGEEPPGFPPFVPFVLPEGTSVVPYDGHPVLLIRNGSPGEKCAIYSIPSLHEGNTILVPDGPPAEWQLRAIETFTVPEPGGSAQILWKDPDPLEANEKRFYGALPAPDEAEGR